MEKQLLIGLVGPAGAGKDTIADHLVTKHHFVKMANADLLKRMARLAFDFTEEQLWGPSELRNAPDKRYPREHGPWTKDDRCAVCGCPGELSDHEEGEQCYLTPRFALQSLGTEWGRMCFENIWVGRLLGIAQALLSGWASPRGRLYPTYSAKTGLEDFSPTLIRPAGVVIPDVRFLNEVDAIRTAAGGKVSRIVRGMIDVFDLHPADGGWISEHKLGDMGPSVILQEATVQFDHNVPVQVAPALEHTSVSAAAAQHRSETELLRIPKEKFDYVLQNSGDLHFLRLQGDRMMDVFKGKIMEFDRGLMDAPPFLREKCKALAVFMIELSRKYFYTEWSEDAEQRLWYSLSNNGQIAGDYDQPIVELEAGDFAKLKALAEPVPGWFTWRDKSYDAPYFIRRGVWIDQYEKHRKA